MTLGANQIAAYAADLLDTDEQIDALQTGKRDLYKAIREEHGKAEAEALKRAIKLARMDAEKRDEAEAIDTEAQRMLSIIERAAHAPRATRVENIEQFGAETAAEPNPADAGHIAGGSHEALTPRQLIDTETAHQSDGDAAVKLEAMAASADAGLGGGSGASASDVEPVTPTHRTMHMTPLEPREAGGLKGFGFTVSFLDANGSKTPDRQPGCQHPKACAGTWRARCHTCETAFNRQGEAA